MELVPVIRAWIDEVKESPWRPVRPPAFIAATLLTVLVAVLSNTGHHWVPLLDGANLLFHEAGHPFFGILADRLGVYGGTLGQFVFPVASAVHFWRRRATASFYASAIWFFENFWYTARYVADARAQELPLVGNGDRLHDWNEILGRWNLLHADTRLAAWLTALGLAGAFGSWWWLFRKMRESNAETAP